MNYPFNSFFINLICNIRDSLLNFFQDFSKNLKSEKINTEEENRKLNELFLDFNAKMEPKIQILNDMCQTEFLKFNQFIKNLILK